MPGREKLPSTLKRSPAKAQRTWIKTHDHAVKEYGGGERAHRTAFAALKHSFEKKGDRWVAKDRKGPSEGTSNDELYQRARELGVHGRSKMDKKELARAIARKQ